MTVPLKNPALDKTVAINIDWPNAVLKLSTNSSLVAIRKPTIRLYSVRLKEYKTTRLKYL